jgi:dephospho-CoA kinase
MKIYGLTGGIGSGKSTVAAMFRARGITVIDADGLAREAVAPATPAQREIVELFGKEVLLEDGRLNRGKLASLVFNDGAKLSRLNEIVHPQVAALFAERGRQAEAAGEEFLIYEVPLLFENNLQKSMAGVILVATSENNQLERAVTRDLGAIDVRNRMKAQMPLSEKLVLADWIVDNNYDPFNTEKQVERIYQQLIRENTVLPSLRAVACHAPPLEERPKAAGYALNPAAGFIVGEEFSRRYKVIGVQIAEKKIVEVLLARSDEIDEEAIKKAAHGEIWALSGMITAEPTEIATGLKWLFDFKFSY